MLNDPYFPFYFRDFMVSTGEMSDAVVGKYVRYLIHQWEKGSLPADPADIQTIRYDRIAWASLEPKFPLNSDGRRRNPRMEKIRSERVHYIAQRSDAGKVGAEARWKHSKRNAAAIADANPTANGGEHNETIASTSISTLISKSPAKEIRADQTAFDRFWDFFPRKVGKEKCRKWWIAHKPDNLEQMLATIKAFKQTEQWQDPKLIPHPYTWLNRGGWDDEIPTEDQPATREPARMEVRTENYNEY